MCNTALDHFRNARQAFKQSMAYAEDCAVNETVLQGTDGFPLGRRLWWIPVTNLVESYAPIEWQSRQFSMRRAPSGSQRTDKHSLIRLQHKLLAMRPKEQLGLGQETQSSAQAHAASSTGLGRLHQPGMPTWNAAAAALCAADQGLHRACIGAGLTRCSRGLD